MPVWVILVLAFGTGFGLGLLFGGVQMYLMMRKRFLTESSLTPTPGVERLLRCMAKCREKHPFGSEAFYQCVNNCYQAKPE